MSPSDLHLQLARMREEIDRLQQQVDALDGSTRSTTPAATAVPAAPAASIAPAGPAAPLSSRAAARPADTSPARSTDRRRFLQVAAGAASGAVVAGVARPSAAAAATGGSLVLGDRSFPSDADHVTELRSPSQTRLARTLLSVENSTGTPGAGLGRPSLAIALRARSTGTDPDEPTCVGVAGGAAIHSRDGVSKGIGVWGTAGGTDGTPDPGTPVGVLGTMSTNTTSGVAVLGLADGYACVAVRAVATAESYSPAMEAKHAGVGGTALTASAPSGIGLVVEGRLWHRPALRPGAPDTFLTRWSFDEPRVGEQHVDADGRTYLRTATPGGSAWRAVTTQHPDHATAGGSVNLLSRPVRVLDTRGNGAPQTNGGKPLTGGTTTTFAVAGVVVDGVSVPVGATGVLGNVTAVRPVSGGYVALFPDADSGTSTVNFAPPQTTANAFISALDADGRLRVKVAGGATHLLVDITGFLF